MKFTGKSGEYIVSEEAQVAVRFYPLKFVTMKVLLFLSLVAMFFLVNAKQEHWGVSYLDLIFLFPTIVIVYLLFNSNHVPKVQCSRCKKTMQFFVGEREYGQAPYYLICDDCKTYANLRIGVE